MARSSTKRAPAPASADPALHILNSVLFFKWIHFFFFLLKLFLKGNLSCLPYMENQEHSPETEGN